MSLPDNYYNIINLAGTKYKIFGYNNYFTIFNKEKLLSKYIYNDSSKTINGKKYYYISEYYHSNGISTILYSTTDFEIFTINDENNMLINLCR
jgi:hypothetical protein